LQQNKRNFQQKGYNQEENNRSRGDEKVRGLNTLKEDDEFNIDYRVNAIRGRRIVREG
jgi:hypothetical protein